MKNYKHSSCRQFVSSRLVSARLVSFEDDYLVNLNGRMRGQSIMLHARTRPTQHNSNNTQPRLFLFLSRSHPHTRAPKRW